MSLLQEASAIFYHPLDSDKTEFLVSQVWTGDPAFTEGIISESASAISFAGMSISSPTTYLTSAVGTDSNANTIDRLTDDKALVAYAGETGIGKRIRVVECSGTTLTFGTPVTFDTDDGLERQFDVAVLTPEKFIVFYDDDDDSSGKARVGSISGTTITLFPEVTFDNLGGDRIRAVTVSAGVSGTAVVTYSPVGGSSGIAIIAAISGVSGTELAFGNKAPYHTGARTEDNFVTSPNGGIGQFVIAVAYQEEDTFDLYIKAGTISGLDITFGSGLLVDESDVLGGYEAKLVSLQENIIALGWKDGSNTDAPREIKCTAFSISGTTLTSGSTFLVEGSRPASSTENMDLVRTNDTTFQFFYNRAGFGGNPTSPGRVHTATLTNVNDLTLDFGAAASLPGVRMAGTWADSLTASKYLYGYRDFDDDDDLKMLVGTLDLDNGLIASSGGAYASASGGEHVTMCMWVQEPTASGSFVVVERGYVVSLSEASGITLGGSTLSWAASGISGLFLPMNDGDPHFIVLDFDHIASGTWELNTSIDGLPFSSAGTRTALAPITTDTAPEIFLSNPNGINQWVDELAIWVNNTKFTDDNLAKLYSLGAVFDLPLSAFSSLSTGVSGTKDAHIAGHDAVDNTLSLFTTGFLGTSGNLVLYATGHEPISDSITLQELAYDVINNTATMFVNSLTSISGTTTLSQIGHDTTSGALNLYVPGLDIVTNDINLFMSAFDVANDQIDLFVGGFDTTSGSVSLLINGPTQIQDADFTMFLCCPFDAVSGILTLQMSGEIPTSDMDRLVDTFIKAPGFNPQLIGRFGTAPTTVTIEIWDLIGGTNNVVPLSSSGVEQIGDTLTWRWSTEFLPVDNNLGHFAFRMTADTGETVDGEFMFDNLEGYTEGHPDDPDDFILQI